MSVLLNFCINCIEVEVIYQDVFLLYSDVTQLYKHIFIPIMV